MKVKKLEDGFQFRAWVGRSDEDSEPDWGLLWDGPGEHIDAWGWDAEGSAAIDHSLDASCNLGKHFLAPVKPGKKRRVEITVRFV